MKDTSTGKLYIYKYKFVDQKFTSVLRKEIGAGIAPHLAEAIAFAANDDFPDVLMYATGQSDLFVVFEFIHFFIY